MKTLWAIQLIPWGSRGKPWINPETIRRTRKGAWAALREGGTEHWHKTIEKRKRSGHLKAVKVTVEAVK